MTHNVPTNEKSSQAGVERQFEYYLPHDSTGYVRPLTEDESAHEYYVRDGYGFFSSDGTLLGGATDRSDIFQRAAKEGFTPFIVH